MKLNNALQTEHLCEVYLTKEKFPIAYAAKKKELMELSFMSEEDAERYISEVPISLELYYSPERGLFAVEEDAIGGGASIYDPYTGYEMEDYDDDDDDDEDNTPDGDVEETSSDTPKNEYGRYEVQTFSQDSRVLERFDDFDSAFEWFNKTGRGDKIVDLYTGIPVHIRKK